ncbi:hypothetical protein HELRODRAFT_184189 [Helobdella robusta]|uniref:Uncharacterized protein n=1 Tax=Helobdella robusta TaxID=6412 RepID=T1FKQ7_HELRO|nr:hypothetical protein HELRODRAFT_184189 [Helobdella robusta]ESO05462.1 hypothetical protein HELRODRAFT_184189 [Helobdella robusta]
MWPVSRECQEVKGPKHSLTEILPLKTLAERSLYQTYIIWKLAKLVDLNLRNKMNWNALMICAAMGHVRSAALLVDLGAKIDQRDFNSKTALHLAIDNQHIKVVEYLLEVGANFCPVILRSVAWDRMEDMETKKTMLLNDTINKHVVCISKAFDSIVHKWCCLTSSQRYSPITPVHFMSPQSSPNIAFIINGKPSSSASSSKVLPSALTSAAAVSGAGNASTSSSRLVNQKLLFCLVGLVNYADFKPNLLMAGESLIRTVICQNQVPRSYNDSIFLLENLEPGPNELRCLVYKPTDPRRQTSAVTTVVVGHPSKHEFGK